MFYCSISNLHLSFLLGDGFTIDLVQAEHAYSVNIWALQATTKVEGRTFKVLILHLNILCQFCVLLVNLRFQFTIT